jgi:hypothetical protein
VKFGNIFLRIFFFPHFLTAKILSIIDKKHLIIQKARVLDKKQMNQSAKLTFILLVDFLFTSVNTLILVFAQTVLNNIIFTKSPYLQNSKH